MLEVEIIIVGIGITVNSFVIGLIIYQSRKFHIKIFRKS